MSNKKSSSKISIRRGGGSSPEGSEATVTATVGSAFVEGPLQAAAVDTAGARADLRVGLDVVLCEY